MRTFKVISGRLCIGARRIPWEWNDFWVEEILGESLGQWFFFSRSLGCPPSLVAEAYSMETNQPEDPTSTELTPETFSAPLGEVFEVPPVAPVVEVIEVPTSGGDSLNKVAAPLDEIGQLAEASARARLLPAEEERLTNLLKEAILGGRAGVSRAVEMLPKVPWIVGVRAIEQVWVDLTSGFRTQLLSGLGKEDSDAARRMRSEKLRRKTRRGSKTRPGRPTREPQRATTPGPPWRM